MNSEYFKEGYKTFGEPRYKGPGKLLYEYVRGSKAYGLDTPQSDEDRGGIYVLSNDTLLSLPQRNTPLEYREQILSDSHDDSWFELSRFFELVCECNPNILESLFVDDRFIIYEDPIITELKKNRDMFVTKQCFDKFGGYAVSQIKKARGLNKKIVKPVTEKKHPLEFCYTFYNQGSTKIENWLAHRNLKQEFCGLAAVPNMHNTYGVYYDWAVHIDFTPGLRNTMTKMYKYWTGNGPYDFTDSELTILRQFEEIYNEVTGELVNKYNIHKILARVPRYYKGIIGEGSQEVRLSSVPDKGERPICFVVYNQEGYSQHARDYTSYKKWERERNPERYSLNKGMNYDRKNMMHAFRLVKMAIEIARGEGVKVFRDTDREFLLGIRNTKYTYDELNEELGKITEEMKQAFINSTLPEKNDKKEISKLLVSIRKRIGDF